MNHLSMRPRTTQVGAKEQNGSVESMNGSLKRSLEQHLLLRGSRDFESKEAYAIWIEHVLEKRNAKRATRLREELAAMRPLSVRRLPSFSVVDVRVGSGSTIRVKRNTYSVPSRLIGEKVRVRVFDDRIEVYLGGQLCVRRERAHGKGAYNVSWRDVLSSMLRKPGALERYQYRDAMFPSEVFRVAYETLVEALAPWSAAMNYLQVLNLALREGECEVTKALERLQREQTMPSFEHVVSALERERPEVPEITIGKVELGTYDELASESVKEAASE